MNASVKKALVTAGKYIFWTAVGAAVTAAVNYLPRIELPEVAVPIIAAGLKSLATYAVTKAKEWE